ncbi:MAG TPA: hypothetical protein VNT79_03710 [Phycisphaerae bacterium]|nr:hypothetical protein [Phycisphaerae bacterium]
MWQQRMIRWRKKLLVLGAMLPVFQATGACDPFGLNSTIFTSLNSTLFGIFVSSVQGTLLEFFPSSDVLATLFGVNRTPIFP